ncbi:uncharacterized protein LOC127708306 [Mytilus californianus]|uniref:uncharacterized protein LOC127708306 n=1 Tax=Mytilus californianus TaxID=6549 RepID=UPI0022474456|nr:uncharacterized protein LOC127708306 [Mytilus californianus]
MEGTPSRNDADLPMSTVLQKLEKLQTDHEDQFLHLKYSIDVLHQQIARMKTAPSMEQRRHVQETTKANRPFYHDNIGMHKEVLRECLEQMVKDIDLENTDLLDDLQTAECLTSDEAAEIIRKPSRRDQVRKLVLHLGRKSRERFSVFLENIQKTSNYPHLANNLMQSYNKRMERGTAVPPVSKCLVCVLKQDVFVKDVIDKLYSNGLVSTETFELVIDQVEYDNKMNWEIILTQLKRSRDPRKARQVLQEALSRKYEHISARINKTHFPEIMCQCRNINKKLLFIPASLNSNTTGSLGDVSTTSERRTFPNSALQNQTRESLSSAKSDNSTQIDYSNIPSTVAWLESIPNDQFVEVNNDISDVVNELVNETQSIASMDIDSVSKTGNLEIDKELESKSTTTFESKSSFHGKSDKSSTPQSYASVVSRKSSTSEPAFTKRFNDNMSHAVKNKCQLKSHVTSGRNKHASITRPAESLSEIGTIYLSKTEKPKSSTSTTNRRSKQSMSRCNDPVTALNKDQNTDRMPKGTKIPSSNQSDHCSILQNVFFEEQRKIHGECSLGNTENSNRPSTFTVKQSGNQLSKSKDTSKENCLQPTTRCSPGDSKQSHGNKKRRKRRK